MSPSRGRSRECVSVFLGVIAAGYAQLPQPAMTPVAGLAPAAMESRVAPAGETPVVQPPVAAPASETTVPRSARDPFWPVGFVPAVPEKVASGGTPAAGPAQVSSPEPETTKPLEWDQARQKLGLRGLSSAGRDKVTGKPRYVAVMAGRLAEVGDTVSTAYEGLIYRWKVVAIGSNGVSLVKLDVRPDEAGTHLAGEKP